jgi:hypothetical protein
VHSHAACSIALTPTALCTDYGFEYSDDEPEEEDVDIENQYYNAKGAHLTRSLLRPALASIVAALPPGFGALGAFSTPISPRAWVVSRASSPLLRRLPASLGCVA